MTTATTAPTKPDRTTLYMAGLEAHMAAKVPPADRAKFLADRKLFWIAEYERWTDRIDRDVATVTDLRSNAADFVLTIAAVSARHAREVRS